MAVLLDPTAAQHVAAPAAARPAQRAAQPAATVKKESPQTPAFVPLSDQANVAFRRDSNGQIYYVVTDAESGRELQEVPARQVRNVHEGIAEFVKELEAKQAAHIKVEG